jgi:hypothetical protein
MRRILIIGMVLWCAGCGNQQSTHQSQAQAEAISTNHGFGWSFDEQSQNTGIRLRLAPPNSFVAVFAPMHIEDVDKVWVWTLEHMQVAEPVNGPFVIYTSPESINADRKLSGLYFSDTATILSDDTLSNYPVGFGHGADINLCHEFTHHILRVTTGDADINHVSPFFDDCFGAFSLLPGQHRT